jgi:ATP/maltotriose-dependent transcriptional regulator MalT
VGALASQVGRAAVSSTLTARELQVLALLSEGCSNLEIAVQKADSLLAEGKNADARRARS